MPHPCSPLLILAQPRLTWRRVSCDLLNIDAHELGAARQKIFIADRFEPNNDPAIVAMATGYRETQNELKMFQDRVGALAPLWWLT